MVAARMNLPTLADDRSDIEKIRQLFSENGQYLQIAEGARVFQEGERYRGIFLIFSGSFKWYKTDADGNEGVLKIYTAGEIAGLPPLFEDVPKKKYVATLTALGAGGVGFWREDHFHQHIANHPESLILFSRHMCATLRDLVEQSSAMSLKDVPARLCDYLNRLGAGARWVTLPLKKHQLATALNTSPETLSRAFKMLRSEGQIEVDGRAYRLIAGARSASIS